MTAKKELFTTPAARALYPKLTEPDTKFKEEGEYSVKLLMAEAEATPILRKCQELQAQAVQNEVEKILAKGSKMTREKIEEKIKLADLPVKPHEDPETGDPTGEYVVTIKMKASGVSRKTGKPWSRRPALFDAKSKPIAPDSIEIWSGSILKVAYSMDPFCTAIGAGVSMRMEAVQIIELHSGGQRNANSYGFEESDGYTHKENHKSPFDDAEDSAVTTLDDAERDF